VRFSYAASEEQLTKAGQRIADALKNLRD
jgi:hypothetical protein